MLISIVVPVYNVDKYLRRCLDSIVSQTLVDFECILVDDASTDNCPVICDEYVEKDKRFKVIHKQKNEGLPEARKSGQNVMAGEFLMHVDSDDWLELEALQLLIKKQGEKNADIVIGSFKQYNKDKITEYIFDDYIISDKQEMLKEFFVKRFKNVWGKLYRSSLFENIDQPSNLIYGEDAIVNTQVISSDSCKIIAIMSDVLYNYDCSTGGISQGIIASQEKAINYFEAYIFIYNYLRQKRHFNIKKHFYSYMFSVVFVKVFCNVPKHEVVKLIKEAKFSYVYFPVNTKSLFYNIMNCLFLVNQKLYKTAIRNYINFRQKI